MRNLVTKRTQLIKRKY